jgi:hypothetical protein
MVRQCVKREAHLWCASERDSSGTTVAGAAREGDGADSPTRTKKTALFLKVLFFFVKRLAQRNFAFAKFN